MSLFAKMKNQRNELLRTPSSMGRQNSMRVDEGRNSWNLLAIKMKARTVVGRGEKSLLVTLDLSYVYGGRKGKKNCDGNRRDEQK